MRQRQMIPTEKQLNIQVAQVCGWTVQEDTSHGETRFYLRTPQKGPYGWATDPAVAWESVPNFCRAYNHLPELWSRLGGDDREGRWQLYVFFLRQHIVPFETISDFYRQACALPLIVHVVAFLQALDAWPSGWEVPDGK